MKNFVKSSLTLAAISIASIAAANPANAFTIGGNVDFDLAGNLLTADFSNETQVIQGAPDPSFSVAGPLSVLDLPLTQSFFSASNPGIQDFIQGFQFQGQNATFDLLAGTDTVAVVGANFAGVLDFSFDGEIRSLVGDNLLATVTGTFSGTETLTNNDFSIDLAATPVPTPALLPGLLGMGAAFVRKRRAASEQSA